MGIGLIQPWHLHLILLIGLFVFSAGKLGQVGGALGQSVKDFKRVASSAEDDQDAAGTEPVATKTSGATAARLVEQVSQSMRREEI